MATIFAAITGNFNSTGTWTGGVVPVGGDVAVANGKTVTIAANIGSSGNPVILVNDNRSVTVGGSTVTVTGAIAGGGFTLNGGLTVYANIYAGATAICLTTGYASPNTSSIVGDIFGGTVANMYGVYINTTGSLTITTAGIQGSTAHAVYHNSTGLLTVVGPVIAGTSGTGAGIVIAANAGYLNLTGNVTAGTGPGIVISGSYATLPHQIVGDITGGSAAAAYGLNWAGYTNVYVTGNVTGGSNATAYGAVVSVNGSIPTFLAISGTCKGGSAGHGVFNSGNNVSSVVTMGKVTGGAGTSTYGSYNSSNNVTFRAYQFAHGTVGMPPYFGYCHMIDPSNPSDSTQQNQMTVYRGGGALAPKTFYDATAVSGLLPSTSDVRSGTTYNNGLNTGTMAVPAAAAVQSGVSVDNTTGTATLSADLIYNYLTSNSLVSGSFGERLAVVATTQTTGQQLADAKG
jgi:hypothetical protein